MRIIRAEDLAAFQKEIKEKEAARSIALLCTKLEEDNQKLTKELNRVKRNYTHHILFLENEIRRLRAVISETEKTW